MSATHSNAVHEEKIDTHHHSDIDSVDTGPMAPNHQLPPISKLPVELMQKIFYLSVAENDPDTARGSKHITPPCVYLCHVSQHWRDMAVSFTNLWTMIHIRLGTPPDFVHYMWERCKDAPINLIIALERPLNQQQPPSSNSPLLEVLAGKIGSDFQRLRVITLQAPLSDLQRIFSKLKDGVSFEKLEFLMIFTDRAHVSTPWDGDKLLGCAAPALRIAQFKGIQLQPNTLILQTGRLSTLEISAVQLDGSTTSSLLAALDNSHQHLQTIQLAIPRDYRPIDARKVLRFPLVRKVILLSMDWNTSLAFLTPMQFNPNTLLAFALQCSAAPPSACQHIWSALKSSVLGSNVFAPEFISFGASGSISQSEQIRMLAGTYRAGNSESDEYPYLNLSNQLCFTILTSGTDLFTRSSQYHGAWSLDRLKTFVAGVESLHYRLWRTIRASATLDRLEVDRGAHFKFAQIFVEGLHGLPDGEVPFPALEALIIRNTGGPGDGPYEWERWRPFVFQPCDLSANWHDERELASDVTWLLRSRRVKGDPYTMTREQRNATGERIKLVQFSGFQKELPDEIRRALEGEACRVIWN